MLDIRREPRLAEHGQAPRVSELLHVGIMGRLVVTLPGRQERDQGDSEEQVAEGESRPWEPGSDGIAGALRDGWSMCTHRVTPVTMAMPGVPPNRAGIVCP